jgi:hypothetical protein
MLFCFRDEQGRNAGAHACHFVGSTLTDPYRCVIAAFCALAAPLGGTSSEEVRGSVLFNEATASSEVTYFSTYTSHSSSSSKSCSSKSYSKTCSSKTCSSKNCCCKNCSGSRSIISSVFVVVAVVFLVVVIILLLATTSAKAVLIAVTVVATWAKIALNS